MNATTYKAIWDWSVAHIREEPNARGIEFGNRRYAPAREKKAYVHAATALVSTEEAETHARWDAAVTIAAATADAVNLASPTSSAVSEHTGLRVKWLPAHSHCLLPCSFLPVDTRPGNATFTSQLLSRF